MKLVFYSDLIQENQLLFWIYIISLIVIMISTIIFVRKEIKNGHK